MGLLLFAISRAEARAADGDVVYDPGVGWSIGTQGLTKGLHLKDGTEIQAVQAGRHPLILRCGGEALLAYTCRKAACEVAVCVAKATGVEVERLAGTWKERLPAGKVAEDTFLEREPRAELTTGVKGDQFLTDAVLIKGVSAIPLAPMLKHLLEGPHCFSMSSLPANKGLKKTFALNWQPAADSAGLAQLADVPEGLYKVQAGRSGVGDSCELDPSSSAWVLLVSERNSAAIEKAWDEASSQIDQMEANDASESTLEVFRHAVLSALADSLGR